jgi:hypothetical protein
MIKNLPLAAIFATFILGWSAPSTASDSQTSPLLAPGAFRFTAAGGVAAIDRDSSFDGDFTFKVGLADRLMLAAPLALGIRLVDLGGDGAVYLGAGIVDLYVDEGPRVAYSPQAVLAAWVRMGYEVSFRAAVDVTGAEVGMRRGEHGLWFRGGGALMVDFGEFATFAMGCTYQRVVKEGFRDPLIDELGWVGDARVSVGSVAVDPFSTLPALAVHMQSFLDLIAIVLFDVDTDLSSTHARFLLGFSLER